MMNSRRARNGNSPHPILSSLFLICIVSVLLQIPRDLIVAQRKITERQPHQQCVVQSSGAVCVESGTRKKLSLFSHHSTSFLFAEAITPVCSGLGTFTPNIWTTLHGINPGEGLPNENNEILSNVSINQTIIVTDRNQSRWSALRASTDTDATVELIFTADVANSRIQVLHPKTATAQTILSSSWAGGGETRPTGLQFFVVNNKAFLIFSSRNAVYVMQVGEPWGFGSPKEIYPAGGLAHGKFNDIHQIVLLNETWNYKEGTSLQTQSTILLAGGSAACIWNFSTPVGFGSGEDDLQTSLSSALGNCDTTTPGYTDGDNQAARTEYPTQIAFTSRNPQIGYLFDGKIRRLYVEWGASRDMVNVRSKDGEFGSVDIVGLAGIEGYRIDGSPHIDQLLLINGTNVVSQGVDSHANQFRKNPKARSGNFTMEFTYFNPLSGVALSNGSIFIAAIPHGNGKARNFLTSCIASKTDNLPVLWGYEDIFYSYHDFFPSSSFTVGASFNFTVWLSDVPEAAMGDLYVMVSVSPSAKATITPANLQFNSGNPIQVVNNVTCAKEYPFVFLINISTLGPADGYYYLNKSTIQFEVTEFFRPISTAGDNFVNPSTYFQYADVKITQMTIVQNTFLTDFAKQIVDKDLIYFAVPAFHQIWMFVPGGGQFSAVCGSHQESGYASGTCSCGGAMLDTPRGIAFDGVNNALVIAVPSLSTADVCVARYWLQNQSLTYLGTKINSCEKPTSGTDKEKFGAFRLVAISSTIYGTNNQLDNIFSVDFQGVFDLTVTKKTNPSSPPITGSSLGSTKLWLTEEIPITQYENRYIFVLSRGPTLSSYYLVKLDLIHDRSAQFMALTGSSSGLDSSMFMYASLGVDDVSKSTYPLLYISNSETVEAFLLTNLTETTVQSSKTAIFRLNPEGRNTTRFNVSSMIVWSNGTLMISTLANTSNPNEQSNFHYFYASDFTRDPQSLHPNFTTNFTSFEFYQNANEIFSSLNPSPVMPPLMMTGPLHFQSADGKPNTKIQQNNTLDFQLGVVGFSLNSCAVQNRRNPQNKLDGFILSSPTYTMGSNTSQTFKNHSLLPLDGMAAASQLVNITSSAFGVWNSTLYMFLVDSAMHCIRRWQEVHESPSSENVKVFVDTIAGQCGQSGNFPYSSQAESKDGFQAQFNKPFGISIPNQKEIYITDEENGVLKKITNFWKSNDTFNLSSSLSVSDRFHTQVYLVAGSEKNKSVVDGTLSYARFKNPSAISALRGKNSSSSGDDDDDRFTLFIVDDLKIRRMANNYVSTVGFVNDVVAIGTFLPPWYYTSDTNQGGYLAWMDKADQLKFIPFNVTDLTTENDVTTWGTIPLPASERGAAISLLPDGTLLALGTSGSTATGCCFPHQQWSGTNNGVGELSELWNSTSSQDDGEFITPSLYNCFAGKAEYLSNLTSIASYGGYILTGFSNPYFWYSHVNGIQATLMVNYVGTNLFSPSSGAVVNMVSSRVQKQVFFSQKHRHCIVAFSTFSYGMEPLAGRCFSGSSNIGMNDGSPMDAMFNHPTFLAILFPENDQKRKLLISDEGNGCIRYVGWKTWSSGKLSFAFNDHDLEVGTYWGPCGTASSNAFTRPSGIATYSDLYGSVFVFNRGETVEQSSIYRIYESSPEGKKIQLVTNMMQFPATESPLFIRKMPATPDYFALYIMAQAPGRIDEVILSNSSSSLAFAQMATLKIGGKGHVAARRSVFAIVDHLDSTANSPGTYFIASNNGTLFHRGDLHTVGLDPFDPSQTQQDTPTFSATNFANGGYCSFNSSSKYVFAVYGDREVMICASTLHGIVSIDLENNAVQVLLQPGKPEDWPAPGPVGIATTEYPDHLSLDPTRGILFFTDSSIAPNMPSCLRAVDLLRGMVLKAAGTCSSGVKSWGYGVLSDDYFFAFRAQDNVLMRVTIENTANFSGVKYSTTTALTLSGFTGAIVDGPFDSSAVGLKGKVNSIQGMKSIGADRAFVLDRPSSGPWVVRVVEKLKSSSRWIKTIYGCTPNKCNSFHFLPANIQSFSFEKDYLVVSFGFDEVSRNKFKRHYLTNAGLTLLNSSTTKVLSATEELVQTAGGSPSAIVGITNRNGTIMWINGTGSSIYTICCVERGLTPLFNASRLFSEENALPALQNFALIDSGTIVGKCTIQSVADINSSVGLRLITTVDPGPGKGGGIRIYNEADDSGTTTPLHLGAMDLFRYEYQFLVLSLNTSAYYENPMAKILKALHFGMDTGGKCCLKYIEKHVQSGSIVTQIQLLGTSYTDCFCGVVDGSAAEAKVGQVTGMAFDFQKRELHLAQSSCLRVLKYNASLNQSATSVTEAMLFGGNAYLSTYAGMCFSSGNQDGELIQVNGNIQDVTALAFAQWNNSMASNETGVLFFTQATYVGWLRKIVNNQIISITNNIVFYDRGVDSDFKNGEITAKTLIIAFPADRLNPETDLYIFVGFNDTTVLRATVINKANDTSSNVRAQTTVAIVSMRNTRNSSAMPWSTDSLALSKSSNELILMNRRSDNKVVEAFSVCCFAHQLPPLAVLNTSQNKPPATPSDFLMLCNDDTSNASLTFNLDHSYNGYTVRIQYCHLQSITVRNVSHLILQILHSSVEGSIFLKKALSSVTMVIDNSTVGTKSTWQTAIDANQIIIQNFSLFVNGSSEIGIFDAYASNLTNVMILYDNVILLRGWGKILEAPIVQFLRVVLQDVSFSNVERPQAILMSSVIKCSGPPNRPTATATAAWQNVSFVFQNFSLHVIDYVGALNLLVFTSNSQIFQGISVALETSNNISFGNNKSLSSTFRFVKWGVPSNEEEMAKDVNITVDADNTFYFNCTSVEMFKFQNVKFEGMVLKLPPPPIVAGTQHSTITALSGNSLFKFFVMINIKFQKAVFDVHSHFFRDPGILNFYKVVTMNNSQWKEVQFNIGGVWKSSGTVGVHRLLTTFISIEHSVVDDSSFLISAVSEFIGTTSSSFYFFYVNSSKLTRVVMTVEDDVSGIATARSGGNSDYQGKAHVVQSGHMRPIYIAFATIVECTIVQNASILYYSENINEDLVSIVLHRTDSSSSMVLNNIEAPNPMDVRFLTRNASIFYYSQVWGQVCASFPSASIKVELTSPLQIQRVQNLVPVYIRQSTIDKKVQISISGTIEADGGEVSESFTQISLGEFSKSAITANGSLMVTFPSVSDVTCRSFSCHVAGLAFTDTNSSGKEEFQLATLSVHLNSTKEASGFALIRYAGTGVNRGSIWNFRFMGGGTTDRHLRVTTESSTFLPDQSDRYRRCVVQIGEAYNFSTYPALSLLQPSISFSPSGYFFCIHGIFSPPQATSALFYRVNFENVGLLSLQQGAVFSFGDQFFSILQGNWSFVPFTFGSGSSIVTKYFDMNLIYVNNTWGTPSSSSSLSVMKNVKLAFAASSLEAPDASDGLSIVSIETTNYPLPQLINVTVSLRTQTFQLSTLRNLKAVTSVVIPRNSTSEVNSIDQMSNTSLFVWECVKYENHTLGTNLPVPLSLDSALSQHYGFTLQDKFGNNSNGERCSNFSSVPNATSMMSKTRTHSPSLSQQLSQQQHATKTQSLTQSLTQTLPLPNLTTNASSMMTTVTPMPTNATPVPCLPIPQLNSDRWFKMFVSDINVREHGLNISIVFPTSLTPTLTSWQLKSSRTNIDASIVNSSSLIVSYVKDSSIQPNPSGFSSLFAVQLQSGYLIKNNATHFLFHLDRLPSYSIVSDESFRVSLSPQAFLTQCPPSEVITLAEFVVVASPIPALKSIETANEVVTTTATAAGLAGSATAAIDMQSMAVMGLMSCAQPNGKAMMGDVRLLAPTATSQSYSGVVWGNFALLAVLCFLQITIGAAIKSVKKLENWSEAFAMTRFPALSLQCIALSFQGSGFAALQLLAFPSDGSEFAVGMLGLLYVSATPIFFVFVARRYLSASYGTYDWSKKYNSKIMLFLLPYGRWEPLESRKRFGGYFSSLRMNSKYWVMYSLVSSVFTLMAAGYRPSNSSGCVGQFSFLSSAYFLFGLAVIIVRPHRSLLANVFSCLSSWCLGMIAVGSAMLAKNPLNITGKQMLEAVVQTQMAVTGVRVLYICILVLIETRLDGDWTERFHWRGTAAKTNEEDDEDEEDNDEETDYLIDERGKKWKNRKNKQHQKGSGLLQLSEPLVEGGGGGGDMEIDPEKMSKNNEKTAQEEMKEQPPQLVGKTKKSEDMDLDNILDNLEEDEKAEENAKRKKENGGFDGSLGGGRPRGDLLLTQTKPTKFSHDHKNRELFHEVEDMLNKMSAASADATSTSQQQNLLPLGGIDGDPLLFGQIAELDPSSMLMLNPPDQQNADQNHQLPHYEVDVMMGLAPPEIQGDDNKDLELELL